MLLDIAQRDDASVALGIEAGSYLRSRSVICSGVNPITGAEADL